MSPGGLRTFWGALGAQRLLVVEAREWRGRQLSDKCSVTCKSVSVSVVALPFRCGHTHRTSRHASETRTTTTTRTPWLTLLTRRWELGGQPHHSLVRVAWHTVGGSTLWTVHSGRFGEARSQPGDCRGSVLSLTMVDRRVDRRTRPSRVGFSFGLS